jgi:hypothetical protein
MSAPRNVSKGFVDEIRSTRGVKSLSTSIAASPKPIEKILFDDRK